MRKELFQPSAEGEARLLLLIDVFSTSTRCLEGRTKLAKLDFLLRYPLFFRRAISIQTSITLPSKVIEEEESIESRMVRYRYGPWDPSYYAILGSLIGKGLVDPVPTSNGIGYRTTKIGKGLSYTLAKTDAWGEVYTSAKALKKYFNWSGTSLKDFIYRHFPEVVSASWGQIL